MNKMEGRLNTENDVSKIDLFVVIRNEAISLFPTYTFFKESIFVVYNASLHPFSAIGFKIASYLFTFSFHLNINTIVQKRNKAAY